MSRITGRVTDFGGARLANLLPELAFIPGGESSAGDWLMAKKPVPVALGATDSFDFTITSSDDMAPPQPYTIRLRYLYSDGGIASEDRWENVWVPRGTFTIGELLAQFGISQVQVLWQATRPDPWPAQALWVNTTNGDVFRNEGTAMAVNPDLVTNIKGVKGDRGFQGVQGPPAPEAVPAMEAVAAYIELDTPVGDAVDGRIEANFAPLATEYASRTAFLRMDQLMAGKPLRVGGNSYLSASTGTFGNLVYDRYGFSSYQTFAVSAYRMQDTAARLIGTAMPWPVGSHGAFLLNDLLNNLIEADTPANRAAALEGMRAVVAIVGAGARVEQSNFTYSANFGDQTENAKPHASGGTAAITTINGATVTIPIANAARHYILATSFALGAERGGVWTFTQNGVTLATVDTHEKTVAGKVTTNYGNMAIDLGVLSVGNVIATFSTNGRANPTYGALDALLVQMATPPLIIITKPIQTTINTHDKPALYNYLRTIPDIIAAEFGRHVLVVDPMTGGWDQDTMLQPLPDGLHLTEEGEAHFDRVIDAAIRRRLEGDIITAAFGTTP
jgi:hypothetical protein